LTTQSALFVSVQGTMSAISTKPEVSDDNRSARMLDSNICSATKRLGVDTGLISNASRSLSALAKALSQAGDAETAKYLHRQAADLELASPELQNCWGGPFNGQKGREALFNDLLRILDPAAVIETGTFRGVTTQWLAENYSGPVLSCEKEDLYYLQAKARLGEFTNVSLHLQDSRLFLKEILSRFPQTAPLMLYLDAHWDLDLPLKEELQIIFSSPRNAVVIIDDFRVPGDSGYGWDDYGVGQALDLALLDGLIPRDWTIYFPALRSNDETGAVRGCCVIASENAANLAKCELLRGDSLERWNELAERDRKPDQPASPIPGADVGDADLRAKLATFEADSAARLEVINRLDAEVQELHTKLDASEADRAARLEVIDCLKADAEALRARVAMSEADRAARLEVIDRLDAEARELCERLGACEADRAARLEVIVRLDAETRDLRSALAASEADRAARLRVIEQLDAEVRELRANLETFRTPCGPPSLSAATLSTAPPESHAFRETGQSGSDEHATWPKISIVIPSLNQAGFLREAIESVVSQAYPQCQLIVMDGGSTDGSVDIIKSFAKEIDYWQSMPDGGHSAAINEGVKRADGDLVCWLNSDDFLLEDALWIVGRAARVHPNFGIYIGNGFRFHEKPQTRAPFCSRSLGFNRRALKEGLDYVQQPSTFYRRSAWEKTGGLDPNLKFGLDWDLLIRVADKYPVVLINEFLSCSREYENTKTASGGLARALELCEISRRHTGQQVTVGALVYLLETLRCGLLTNQSETVCYNLAAAEQQARKDLVKLAGHSDGFPVSLDAGDVTFVPLANSEQRRRRTDGHDLPTISIVTPSFNQAEFLPRTLASVAAQRYPRLEHIVMDGGSTDGSRDVLTAHSDQLSYWEHQKDHGAAHAINKGFRRATGEVLSWLNSDDMLADGALDVVGRIFRDNPEVDAVFGNAIYVDADDKPIVVDHGDYKTALYFGVAQPRERIPAYWSYVHAVPQPTVFFRRRLLDKVGFLDEEYKFIFDFELFFRFSAVTKLVKIERTLAFYRIHQSAKTAEWSNFLVELYYFSRKNWPRWRHPHFRTTRASFVNAFMKREWPFGRETARARMLFWIARKSLAAAVTLRLVNPEAVVHRLKRWARDRVSRDTAAPVLPEAISDRASTEGASKDASRMSQGHGLARYSAMFCGFFLPLSPGLSGGEIRDFHILCRLINFCRVSFVSLHGGRATTDPQRTDVLSPRLEAVWDREAVLAEFGNLVRFDVLRHMQRPMQRTLDYLRRRNVPVVGPRLPRDTSWSAKIAAGYFVDFIQSKLGDEQRDFLFVSPQVNPLGMLLDKNRFSSRLILATYDVETVRLSRIAAGLRGLGRISGWLEAQRGEEYERCNLRVYDGIIAVSELDRQLLIRKMDVEPERVIAIENGVDVQHFSYCERRYEGRPAVLFVGAFTYWPNHLAAVRLIDRIMPQVWKVAREAQVWIVGQQPEPSLRRRADGRRVFVTGRVDSVLPYLRQCSLVCAPIEVGSGTKYKVLEALAAGAPVVCTRVAAEGLDLTNEHVMLADNDAEIAAAICAVLQSPERSAAMSKRARSLIEEKYSWDVVLSKLEPWLDRIASLPRKA